MKLVKSNSIEVSVKKNGEEAKKTQKATGDLLYTIGGANHN